METVKGAATSKIRSDLSVSMERDATTSTCCPAASFTLTRPVPGDHELHAIAFGVPAQVAPSSTEMLPWHLSHSTLLPE